MTGYIGHTRPISGEAAPSTVATQLSTSLQTTCKRVYLRATSTNTATGNSVYVGFTSGVTPPDKSSDATTGIELAPSDPALWIDIQNTNQIWYISGSTNAGLTVLILT